MKQLVLVILLFFNLTTIVMSQIAPPKPESANCSWRTLDSAVKAFDERDYSKALNLAIKAKDNRHAEIDWEYYILESALSPYQVRREGEKFMDVLPVLKERDETEAITLINKYLSLKGESFFNDSVYSLLEWVKSTEVYPEADYLIGKIYQLEGEYKTAYDYYEQARCESDYLDIPSQKIDILYSMSDLAIQSDNVEQYEQILVLILNEDKNFKNQTLLDSFIRTIDTDKASNFDRFFMLYRADFSPSSPCLRKMSDLYESRQEYKKSLECISLLVMESFTHIFSSIQERDKGYKYTTMIDFFNKCSDYPDIIQWCQQNKVWESFYLMADKIEKRGKVKFAKEIFFVMSISVPDLYWAAEANQRS